MNHQAEKMKLFSVYRVEKKNLVIHLSQFLEFVKGPPPPPPSPYKRMQGTRVSSVGGDEWGVGVWVGVGGVWLTQT